MTSHAADHEKLVREVFERISTGRYDDVVELMHEDLVFELPYGGEGIPATLDRQSYAALQSATFQMFEKFALELTEVHELADPDGLICEYRSDAVVAANGKPYRNRYVGVFRFRDGKIAAWREFHNPDVVTEAFAP